MKPRSTIGVRATWTCAKCPATTNTHQLAAAAMNAVDRSVAVILDAPEGWTARGEQTFCPAHGRRAA